jgi:hypothetical protein
MNRRKVNNFLCIIPLAAGLLLGLLSCRPDGEKIGVLYVLHGGMKTNGPQYMWDSVVQQFSYDHNHSIYNYVIWDPSQWPNVLDRNTTDFARRFLMMYDFGYERMGGIDPYPDISDKQLAHLKDELKNNTHGLKFEVDWVGYLSADYVEHYPYPRFIYNIPDVNTGYPPLNGLSKCTYCGGGDPGGPWEKCDPERYNADGPVERLLKKGVTRIIMVDMTTSGVRFSKTFDVVQMTKRALNKWNNEHGTSIPLVWVNDPNNLMERSYPTKPEGWTRIKKAPEVDPLVPLEGNPNPIAEDPMLALLHAEGIEKGFSDSVSDNATGVILFNHALNDYNEYFDPKIDDTLILNKNIKALLIERHPDIDPDHIIGAFGGIMEVNPVNGREERTREMRGETYGYAWLYESNKQMPGEEWGYRYWDALEYLKNCGVKHIVIGFPQMITDNNLNLIEVPQQIGKEIGIKTWAKYDKGDFTLYPEVGHPFADYWGVWVDANCGEVACCFEMGGCADGRPYPPPRQTPIDAPRGDLDPSLAFDMSAYGHLGFDETGNSGPPDHDKPVQDQYTGTWDLYRPANDDPRLGQLLASHVLDAALKTLQQKK